jgi:hypothetical protein
MSEVLHTANISFHTNDEDKDGDTQVVITLRDNNRIIFAKLASNFGHFNDHSDTGPFDLEIRNKRTIEQINNGYMVIRINPNGNDTWRFDFDLRLDFLDKSENTITTLSGGKEGLELNQNGRQETFYFNDIFFTDPE